MIALAFSVFMAGLLGSVHCAGMCGSFACLAAGGVPGRAGASWHGTTAYSAGRLLSYVVLGMLAGAAGAGLDRLGAVAGFTRPAAVMAGVLLMLWGTATLLATLGVRLPALAVPPAIAAVIARGVRAVQASTPFRRGLGLGMLTAALPCGWLYAFVATAAAAGSAWRGGLVMAAFWAGTVPMMVAVGFGVQRLLGPLRRRLPVITAAALVVIGALTVAGRFIPSVHPSLPNGAAERGHDSHR